MRKLAWFNGGMIAAVLFCVYGYGGTLLLAPAGVLLVLALVLRRKNHRDWRWAAALGLCVGMVWTVGYSLLVLKPARQLTGENRPVEATLQTMPWETRYGAAAEVLVEGRHRATLYADESLLMHRAGDTISCTGKVEAVKTGVWNGERLNAVARGSALLVFARETELVERGNLPGPVALRLWLQRKIDGLYTGDVAGLLRALLTGDQRGLRYGVKTNFSLSGISHVIAVSGMHLSLLVFAASLLCLRQPRMTAFLSCPLIVTFVLMTGASPSVCRAAVMQLVLLFAPVAMRQNDPQTTLSMALAVLLFQNPWAIASVSLQMSFAAVAGLYLFAGPMREKLLSLWKKPGRLARALSFHLAATFSATVLTLPLSWLYFGTVSLAAPLTNVLVLWAVSLLMPLGLASVLLGSLGALLAWPVRLLGAYVLGVSGAIAAVPYAAASVQSMGLLIWTVAAYLLQFYWLLSKKQRMSGAALALALGSFLLVAGLGRAELQDAVTVLDVGQGQCIILRHGGFTALVDCGGTDDQRAGEQAARSLRSAGIHRADLLILTHFDRDHVGGVPYLLDQIRVGMVLCPAAEDRTGTVAALQAREQDLLQVSELTKISFPTGNITVYPPVSLENDNNSGLCVLATAAEYDILITGDLDRSAEWKLLSRWEPPPVEVLVAGHHGAANATSRQLLERVKPQTVVISAGKDNPYGHPHADTLARIREAGAAVLRTDQQGTIRIKP